MVIVCASGLFICHVKKIPMEHVIISTIIMVFLFLSLSLQYIVTLLAVSYHCLFYISYIRYNTVSTARKSTTA